MAGPHSLFVDFREEQTVTVRFISWRSVLPRAVALAVTAALVPVPAFAADTHSAPKAKTSQTTLQQAVAREVAKMPTARVAARGAQASEPKQSGSFFKTGPGIAALVVLGVGAGYAIYSANHDRIHSPAKK
jgi:hypothetical protein